MRSLENLKILIVGLTTVISLTNFNKDDFQKGIIKSQIQIKAFNQKIDK